jgi:shikimate kinase
MKPMGIDTEAGTRDNIILIGMPGSGKSTVGVLVAKYTARSFVDTDLLIQADCGSNLEQILRTGGHLAFRRLEERIVQTLCCSNSVIATGGSVPYSQPAMGHLMRGGVVVFLDVPLRELALRIGDMDARGVSRRPGQTLAALNRERRPLYAQYAQVTVNCGGRSQEAVARRVVRQVAQRGRAGQPRD